MFKGLKRLWFSLFAPNKLNNPGDRAQVWAGWSRHGVYDVMVQNNEGIWTLEGSYRRPWAAHRRRRELCA